MKKSLSILAALALLLAGCVDPTMPGPDGALLPDDTGSWGVEDEWDLDEIEDDPEEDDPVDPVKIIKKAFTFVSEDTNLVGESVSAETVLGVITLPETGETWTTTLVSGYGDTDNDKFDLMETPGPNPSVMSGISYSMGSGGGTVSLAVKKEVTLEWGHYSARVGINNGSDTYTKVFEFDVTLSPPLFKEAPKVYPIVAGGKNYTNSLNIKWDKRATATSYTVYVGKTDDFKTASVLPGTYNGSSDSATMTAFPGEGAPLPDDTAYWVWITATNGSGTTPPSPAAKKKTTVPVPEFFWKANDDNILPLFDCYAGDRYRFTETTTEVGMGMTIKYWFGVEHYIGDVYYHEKFDPISDTNNSPFPNTGKDNAVCNGYPAGVFVIKYQEDHVSHWLGGGQPSKNDPTGQKRYSAVYYWGMGTIRPGTGAIESYIVNQWGGYAETITLEEALDRFTCARVASFVHVSPEAYLKEFHKQNLGTHGGEPEFPY